MNTLNGAAKGTCYDVGNVHDPQNAPFIMSIQCGFTALYPRHVPGLEGRRSQNALVINKIYVKNEYRRQGVLTAFLEWLSSFASEFNNRQTKFDDKFQFIAVHEPVAIVLRALKHLPNVYYQQSYGCAYIITATHPELQKILQPAQCQHFVP